jgi:molybdate transport system substrate-binding protein
MLRRFALLWIALAMGAGAAFAAERPPVTVYAAASLKNVLNDLGAEYERRTQVPVKFSFAASSLLAKHIEAGTKADVFVSADQE